MIPISSSPFFTILHHFENFQVRFLLPLPSGHLLCGGSGGSLSLLEPELSSSAAQSAAEVVQIAGVSSTDFAAATVTQGTTEAMELVAGAMNGSLLKLRLDIETRWMGDGMGWYGMVKTFGNDLEDGMNMDVNS
jgi:hypothetical protein